MLSGFGGTGKSTLLKIFQDLVGLDFALPVELGQLNNRFEKAGLPGASLLSVSDESFGSIDLNSKAGLQKLDSLNSISGSDLLRIEEKYVPGFRTCRSTALITVSTNTPFSAISTGQFGAIQRRFIRVPMMLYRHNPINNFNQLLNKDLEKLKLLCLSGRNLVSSALNILTEFSTDHTFLQGKDYSAYETNVDPVLSFQDEALIPSENIKMPINRLFGYLLIYLVTRLRSTLSPAKCLIS
jgi:hypothetical protein